MKPITIHEIAHSLKIRQGASSSTVLFLGARAGGLFGNGVLYENIKGFRYSTTNFDTLPDTEQFQECYRVLEDRFNESNRHDVLTVSLKKGVNYRSEDDCLAELVKAGVFDTIISTCIDTLLEEALLREQVGTARGYHLRIVGLHSTDIITTSNRDCTVLKIFGDLSSRKYASAGNEFTLDADRALKQYLERALRENVLIVGYDPVWDRPIERAFDEYGGDIIHVNEEELAEQSHIAQVIQMRRGQCLIGGQGGYRRFMKDLHREFTLHGPLSYESIQKVSAQLQDIQKDLAILKKSVLNLENWLKPHGEN